MPGQDFGDPTGRPHFTNRSETLPENTQIPVLRMMVIPEIMCRIVKYLKVDKRFKSLGALWDEDMKSLKYLEVLLLS